MAAMPVFGSDGSTCEADPAGAGTAERPGPGPGPGPGRMRRTLLGLLVWVPSVLMATWAVARTFGLERSTYPVQLVSFTPYVAAASIVPLIVGLCLRRWIPAGVAAVAFAALIACVAPRAIPSSSESLTTSSRPTLRVMTHNVYLGKASASALVDRIRQERIDVLALQELTESMIGDLDRAGIAEFLPYRSLNALGGASGTGVFSEFPIERSVPHVLSGSGFVQTAATIAVPGAGSIEIESVHPCPPNTAGTNRLWRSDLAQQPAATPEGTLRILLGDFNATLDHAKFRDLLATGYRDAASAVGKGLTATWPNDGQVIPGVVIDHILVDRRVGVRAASIHDIAGSDHRAVFAELALPAASP